MYSNDDGSETGSSDCSSLASDSSDAPSKQKVRIPCPPLPSIHCDAGKLVAGDSRADGKGSFLFRADPSVGCFTAQSEIDKSSHTDLTEDVISVSADHKEPSSERTVVIIGAGSSGIGAAQRFLLNQDAATAGARGQVTTRVIILEARDRIGGRVNSTLMSQNLRKDLDSSNKCRINLGANWIHGLNADINPLYGVAVKLGLKLFPTSSDDDPGDDAIVFDRNPSAVDSNNNSINSEGSGEPRYEKISNEDFLAAVQRYEWMKVFVEETARDRAAPFDGQDSGSQCSTGSGTHSGSSSGGDSVSSCVSSNSSGSLSHSSGSSIASEKYPGRVSVEQIFREAFQQSLQQQQLGHCSRSQAHCIGWFLDRVSIDLGAKLSVASHLIYAEGESDGEYGEALMATGSYSVILQHLLDQLPVQLHLNCHVAKISVLDLEDESCDPRVLIECEDGSCFRADACVVTAPLSVLRADRIQFLPTRPSRITHLCSNYQMGLMNLVWLWYPHVFWPAGCNFIGVARDTGIESEAAEESSPATFSTFLAPPAFDQKGEQQAMLMCQVTGPFAEHIEQLTEAEVAALATAELRRIFGSDTPDAVGCCFSRWRSDPYAGGSWSIHSVTQSGPLKGERYKKQHRRQHRFSGASFSSNLSKIVSSGGEVPRELSIIAVAAEEDEDAVATAANVARPISGSSASLLSDAEDLSIDSSPSAVATAAAIAAKRQRLVDHLVCYAGEADSTDNRGTVHGAFLSGQAAAARILRFLNLKQSATSK